MLVLESKAKFVPSSVSGRCWPAAFTTSMMGFSAKCPGRWIAGLIGCLAMLWGLTLFAFAVGVPVGRVSMPTVAL
eukprot:8766653-Ditylum_brightwellii.AAC.1